MMKWYEVKYYLTRAKVCLRDAVRKMFGLAPWEPPMVHVVRSGGTYTAQARQDWRRRLDPDEDMRQFWRHHEARGDAADIARQYRRMV